MAVIATEINNCTLLPHLYTKSSKTGDEDVAGSHPSHGIVPQDVKLARVQGLIDVRPRAIITAIAAHTLQRKRKISIKYYYYKVKIDLVDGPVEKTDVTPKDVKGITFSFCSY